jgi:hypothetical protein
MEDHLEVLLELDFCTKPPNFGVEAHMEASTGVALRIWFSSSSFFHRPKGSFYSTLQCQGHTKHCRNASSSKVSIGI